MATQIHSTAVVSPGAELGQDVTVGPYTVIGPRVRVGDGTRIGPQVVIDGVTTIGRDNVFFGQANIGADPQDLSYEGEPTHLVIGDRNAVREFVTVNRGTVKGGGVTSIGNDCLLMACSHVAHDCEIGNRVMLANNALLAGHVAVEDSAVINGAAAVHQFVTIGKHAYIGGLTRVFLDVPPYMVLEGHPARVRKVNTIGLERSGFAPEDVAEVRAAFRMIYRSGEPRQRVLKSLAGGRPCAIVRELIEFLQRSELGAKGRYRESLREEFRRAGAERVGSVPSGT